MIEQQLYDLISDTSKAVIRINLSGFEKNGSSNTKSQQNSKSTIS